MNKRIKIGIDLDDTIWDFTGCFIKFFNEKFGTNYLFEELKEFAFDKFFNKEMKELYFLFEKFWYSNEFNKLPLIEGAFESVNNLKEDYDLVFITSRSIKHKQLTIDCLKNCFKDFEPKVYFTNDENEKTLKSKGEIGFELGISYMVDNCFENLIGCIDKGVKCFLIDNPWNKNIRLHKNIIRVENWNEILGHLGGENAN